MLILNFTWWIVKPTSKLQYLFPHFQLFLAIIGTQFVMKLIGILCKFVHCLFTWFILSGFEIVIQELKNTEIFLFYVCVFLIQSAATYTLLHSSGFGWKLVRFWFFSSEICLLFVESRRLPISSIATQCWSIAGCHLTNKRVSFLIRSPWVVVVHWT
jgi:hypothetical protein